MKTRPSPRPYSEWYPAPGTYALGINNTGSIVGYYYTATNISGFVDDAGTFSTVLYPGATGTEVTAINDLGVIVGTYTDSGGYVAVPIPVASTPEPATMILLGSGLLGLAAYGRKKFFKK